MPRVSVLIPTFNRARYLPEAVSSVLNQTYRDLEVVIVDDGSTDNTAEVVRAFGDPRVRYLCQENRGTSAALNTAWRAARGEHIARLDSDDAWLPNFLAALVPALEADAELGVIYARAQAMDAQGKPLAQIMGAAPRFPGKMLKSLLYADCVCPIAVVLRAACLARVGGYDESLPGTEDWDVWLRMAEHFRFEYRDKILARYRFHPQNITGARSEQYARLVRDRARVLEKFYARDDVPAEAIAVKPLAFRNLYMDITIRHLASGRWRDAFTYFTRTLRAAPNPVASALRVVAVAFFYVYLSKTRWGVRLVESLLNWRRAQAR
jgi:glycosyltransferase involved in cell wall biosynthesis